MEKLKKYMLANKLNGKQLAAQIKVDPSTISRFLKGTQKPTLDLAFHIQDATNGKVKATDWLSK